MKRFNIVIIVLITALSLSACGKDVTKKTGDGDTAYYSSTATSSVDEGGGSGTALNEDAISLLKSVVTYDGKNAGSKIISGFPDVIEKSEGEFTYYPEGYGENTTGGRGASQEDVYECATGSEVISALETIKRKQSSNGKTVSAILITGTITEDNTTPTSGNSVNYQIIVDSIDDLIILGANENAVFDGVGINFKSCDNVIVQNVTVHHPSKTLKNEKDCLEFNNCNDVWVDHCELYNDYPSNSAEKDYYDGLLDVKNNSSGITVSYNYLHDAFKTSLIGSGPDDTFADRAITFHHNVFENCNSRIPLIRSGYAHIYDNYYKNCLSRCVNTRIGAKVYVEHNVFASSKRPVTDITDGDPSTGYYNAENNTYISSVDCDGSNCDFKPSYRYTREPTEGLKEYLAENAGVNKVDVEKCKSETPYRESYVLPNNVAVDQYIERIGEVTFDNECAQKILFAINKADTLNDKESGALKNKDILVSAAKEYLALYAADFDERVNAIDLYGEFSHNASIAYRIKEEYDSYPDGLKNKITAYSAINDHVSYYDQNFERLFNEQIAQMKEAPSLDRDALEELNYLANLKPELGLSTAELTAGEIKMDLSEVPTGRTSGVTQAGGVYLGTSTDVRATDKTFGAKTYEKAVFISGYGNTGSKCLQFSVYSTSNVTIVLESESGVAKVLVTDPDKNIICDFLATEGIDRYVLTDLPIGEYRLFTDIPSGSVTGAKLFVYEFVIAG